MERGRREGQNFQLKEAQRLEEEEIVGSSVIKSIKMLLTADIAYRHSQIYDLI